MNVDDFADKYFGPDANKAVPLSLLRAWLSQNHDHGEDGVPFVPSMELDKWARKVAVSRIVDHGPDPDRWAFFEHGWHKAGAACETHLTQSQARIGDPIPVTMLYDSNEIVVRGTLPEAIAELVKRKQVGGMSIADDEGPVS